MVIDPNDAEALRTAVRETYGQVASGGTACCGGNVVEMASLLGYADDDVAAAPEGANLGLGCGAPLQYAEVREGETVLDLGSGAGFDAFIARRLVGETGHVIGVDMTPEMIQRARANARRIGAANVEFRLGEIEHLPVETASVDLVISNCVLNLVPDKDAAFREVARVLRPGGRMCVSDIVLTGELPEALRDSAAAYAGCVSGAIPLPDYLAKLAAAGLTGTRVVRQVDARDLVLSAGCCGEGLPAELTEGLIASVTVVAYRP